MKMSLHLSINSAVIKSALSARTVTAADTNFITTAGGGA